MEHDLVLDDDALDDNPKNHHLFRDHHIQTTGSVYDSDEDDSNASHLSMSRSPSQTQQQQQQQQHLHNHHNHTHIHHQSSQQQQQQQSHPHLPSPSSFSSPTRRSRRRSTLRSKPRSIRTPTSPIASTLPNNNLPSAPASPPTPAPSPSPHRRLPDWSTADADEEAWNKDIRGVFKEASNAQKERILAELLNLCDSRQLIFVHDFVCPRLKKDPFTTLPNEICLRILSFVDNPKTLARSSRVSRRWHDLVNDDMAWKTLFEMQAYRPSPNDSDSDGRPSSIPDHYTVRTQSNYAASNPDASMANSNALSKPYPSGATGASNSAPDLSMSGASRTPIRKSNSIRTKHLSYRSHFKRRYMVETAWRTGGRVTSRQITPDQGVVTSLHLTDKYIVFALDNAKIHVFDAGGSHQKTLHGHLMGVWAMVPWGDMLVSGGCDRDVRVWNMATGQSVFTLRGHSSTVRCLKMSDANTAITGSRDTTLRIWDIQKGYCKHVLVGHQASVRCIDVHGDLIASGSYDTMAKIWSISEGRCLRTLSGHFSQIYAIAFDGKRVATGSLDTSVRIWDAMDGKCLAVLQGHTSLVGQLQMRGETLVTGGSDGSVRVWSLEKFAPILRLAAHDNSVTSLQFNESRIISGGSDGRVKVWDLKTGSLVRELSQPAESVWRVVFEEEKAIIMANRNQKTIMEVWSFAPPEDTVMPSELDRAGSPMSLPEVQTPSSLIPTTAMLRDDAGSAQLLLTSSDTASMDLPMASETEHESEDSAAEHRDIDMTD